jgi:hypothetical protein
MSCASECPGAFPALGPVTYLPIGEDEVEAALLTPAPEEQTWFHATNEYAARAACRQGLIPSCWVGGDSCCVFGYDTRGDIPAYRGEWVLEIRSHALASQLKAWWVPVNAIRRIWTRGEALLPSAVAARAVRLASPKGCDCELAGQTKAQIERWRATWD